MINEMVMEAIFVVFSVLFAVGVAVYAIEYLRARRKR